ncbi:MAG: ATP-dependent helicase, partial [Anaerolineales bacterium]|nr:ATP-dependent helicase [Anaerolineales bacterium]
MITLNPRPHQAEILAYTQGSMGISAVPGSGKTWTLSALAAKLIAEGYLDQEQEILIVTLTNSAVDNFALRIEGFLSDQAYRPLIPRYRVRTLHGLAHDIVRERPELAGLDSDFQIIDERAANSIRSEIASAWLRAHPNALDDYLSDELEDSRLEWIKRERLPELIDSVALAYIRTAKDQLLTPDQIQTQLAALPIPLPLAEMGAAIYHDYQRALAYRGAVDFDDLIGMALQILRLDIELLDRLQQRWPYILEDEAQDSSRLQEQILRTLVGQDGNWVRVGDPNQAIFESFTTANPRFLRQFMTECDHARQLPNSGRSTGSIIDLANYLIDWVRAEHPYQPVRDALDEPYIEPTPPDDPQPNPPDRPQQIYLVPNRFSPQGELEAVADSIERWLVTQQELPHEQQETVAVLVPRNTRGFALRDLLAGRGIEVVDSLLRSSSQTRMAAGALGNLLGYLADPQSARKLGTVYKVWRREARQESETWNQVEAIAGLLA